MIASDLSRLVGLPPFAESAGSQTSAGWGG